MEIRLQLTSNERRLLEHGLAEWGGPAHATDKLAIAMGFDSLTDMEVQRQRLGEAVAAGIPLSKDDWSRVLAATEVAFVSEVWGSGWDWAITFGESDEATLRIIRELQKKLRIAGAISAP